jgi:hypothetical protein
MYMQSFSALSEKNVTNPKPRVLLSLSTIITQSSSGPNFSKYYLREPILITINLITMYLLVEVCGPRPPTKSFLQFIFPESSELIYMLLMILIKDIKSLP